MAGGDGRKKTQGHRGNRPGGGHPGHIRARGRRAGTERGPKRETIICLMFMTL